MRRLVPLSALVLMACSYHAATPRRVRILAVADPAFRTRAHWRDVISSRMHSASQLFDSEFRIRLELTGVSEWNPDPHAAAEPKRRQLGAYKPDSNVLYVGFTAPDGGGPEPGIALAFDRRVLVYDYPAMSEEQNEMNLAHELAHVFGAWHSRDASSILHLPPGKSFDSAASQTVWLTRLMKLGEGPSGLDPGAEKELAKLYANSGGSPEANPLFQSYLFIGHELWNTGYQELAREPLTRAAELSPGDINVHYMLGRTHLFLKSYPEAEGEFRKVVRADPKHSVAWNSLGGTLLNLNENEQAVEAFRKARELDPGNPSVRANLGRAIARLPGKGDQGVAEIQAALRAAPGDAYVQQTLESVLAEQRAKRDASKAPNGGAR